ncbi:OmpA family protein [Pseudanabaena sp. BC1403]|uniref:OmpA family protein n=1 Tax=Pseudanabaena sp. BC1403 TaxID=2043171 RepID=UPI000CD7F4F8|nr:OmpA family protein [Pseudanabaena sp. BC1403]
MRNTSAPLMKLGILVFPQVLLLLMSATVKAELVTDVKPNPEIKRQDSLTNQVETASTQPSQSLDQSSNTEKVSSPVKTPASVTDIPKTANTVNTSDSSSPRIVILSPTVGTVLDAPAATVVIQMPSNTKIELLVNGKVVDSNSIGRSELDETNKTITQTWYGVSLQAGNNQITARAIGSDTASSSINLKVRGAPTKLVVSTLESKVPADGRSYVTVDGQLVDEDGNRSNWEALVTLEASEGEFIGTDASSEQPGFQVQAKQGKFSAQLKAGLKTGTVTIRARNAQMEAFTQVQFETDLRPSLVTGVIDLRVGARGTDFYRSLRDFLPADLNNSTQVDLYGAVFGTGRVGEWLFTGAYNNSRTLNQDCAGNSSLAGTEKYCDQQYPVYGDSSTVTRTTPSYDSLYLRFERNSPVQGASTDYFMWGNYSTEEFASRSQQFSAISRQLQGFKGNFNLGDLQITGFYSNVGKGFQRDTITPNGTSGTYFLSKRLLINGSENVTIELIDFFSAGTVVSRQELVRGKDYDINYDNGSILFRQPLLQTQLGDVGQLLRRQIVVTYQNEQVGGDSNIYGGQLRYHLNRSQSQPSWIGANYFKESLGIRNFVLYGANALISFGEKTQLIAEYARSQNDSEVLGYVSGSAMRFELNSEIASGILGKLYYSKAETGFANNATISFVPGQTRYGGDLSAKISPTTSLQFRYDQEDNVGIAPRPLTSLNDLLNVRQEAIPGSAVNNSLRTISLGVQQNIGAALLNLDVLYRDRQDRQLPNVLSSNSTQLRSRLSVPIADNLRVTAQNEVSLSASSDAVIPDRSVLALDWTIVQGLTARLGQQWFHSGALAGQAITSADLLGEYKLGTDTTFTGRYSVIGGANNAASTQGALGINQRWQVLPGLRMSFGYEHVFGSFTTATTTGTSFLQPFAVGQASSALTIQNGHSYNVGVEYTDNPDFKASARFEHRSDNTNSNTVFSAAALGKLSPALTMLFNYQQSSAANQLISGLGTISNLKVGLAYRDPEDDKFNVLLRYEYRQNPSIVPDSLLLGSGSGYNDHTLALEAIYAPNWQWEFYGKLALRNSTTTIARDFTGVSNTNLSQFRVTYRLGYNVELVGETRLLNQPTAGYSELGLVGEVGYFLTPNLRLAAGYSSGSVNVDRDFSGSRSTGGLYAGITVKLNELFDGFGLQKTPPRQQQDPVEPVAPIAQTPQPTQKQASIIPASPQIISLNVARSLTFKEGSQGSSTELASSDIAVLENLAAVLKEYNNLSIDIQGYIGSLADMNSGDNLAANRMMAARKYLLDRGVTSTQMTLRSLGSIASANSSNQASVVANAAPVSFAISGKADVFNAIATRLQTISSNSPATEFLQSILPNAAPILQANATPVNNLNNTSANISTGVNVGNDGKIADLSYATLDRMVERLNANPNAMFEIQTSSTLSASAGQDLETFKMLAVRSYLLDKGVSSDRILLSSNGANTNSANQSGNSQVYISLSQDDSNTNIAAVPPKASPTAQANTTTVPTPLASSTTSTSPLAVLLASDRRLSNWLESAIPDSQLDPQFKPAFDSAIQIPNLGSRPLLTQLPKVESLLLAIASPADPALSSDVRSLWSYAFESSPTQLLSMLIGNELTASNPPSNSEDIVNAPANNSANRRLATAFNFLLSNNGDTVTAFMRAIGVSTTEKSGFAINPDQLSNLKN